MDNRITEQTIGFINAMPGSQVYYYSALAPSILVNEQAIPEVHYQIFRSSATAQPTTYYAILSLQTQLNSSMAAAQAAAGIIPIFRRTLPCSPYKLLPALPRSVFHKLCLNC